MLRQALCIISKPSWNSRCNHSPETPNLGQSRQFFPRDLEIWRMTLKNNRTPLLCYFKLCASFCSHGWIAVTWVTVRRRPIWVKIGDFLSSVACKFDGWHWKTVGHVFHASSNFVSHFIAISEFKTGVAVWRRPIWVKIGVFCPLWHWDLADDLEKQ